MTQIVQRTFDPGIAPSLILPGHAHNQVLNRFHHRRSTGFPISAAVLFLGHQLLVPPTQRVRCDQRTDFLEDLPTYWFGFDGQPSPLLVVEPRPSPAQQFMQCPVFLHEELNDPILLLG